MESDAAINEDFNLSTAESTTVIELAKLMWNKIRGDEAEFNFVSDDPFTYDVQRRIPDVTKARAVLGFEANTSLDQMLDIVIPWIREALATGLL
jgi:nucleoside-diphosphate-sugar epimerase